MIDKLSRQDEDRILTGLEKVAVLVNEGSDPNEAITKVATELKIPAGHIEPMVYAYNTGRTNIQRKNHEDIYEKAAEFPIADAQRILSDMYPQQTKSAGNNQELSVEYSRSPEWYSRNRAVKAASAIDTGKPLTDKKAEAYPGEDGRDIKKAFAQIQSMKQRVDQFKSQKCAMFDGISRNVEELANYFRTPGCIPYQQVRENTAMLYGDSAGHVLNMVQNRYPACQKQAASNKWASVDENKTPYSLVRKIVSDLQVYNQFSAKLAKAEKAAAEAEGQLLRPFVPSPRSNSVIDGFQSSTKEAEGFLGTLFNRGADLLSGSELAKSVASEVPGVKPTPKLLSNDLQKLNDPQHEEDLREAQVEAMLNDLLANDEIISSHKPDDVIRIFNELNQIAPRAANQKMLVRSLLRKRLQYGGDQVDPVDVQQLLEIENKLKDREQISDHAGSMGIGPLGPIVGA